jgi:hypothetical protein
VLLVRLLGGLLRNSVEILFLRSRLTLIVDSLEVEPGSRSAAVVKKLIEVVRFKNIVHRLIHNIFDQRLSLPQISTKRDLSDFGAFLKSKEEVLAAFGDVCVRVHGLGLHVIVVLALPVDAALDFTFEVGWVLGRLEGHLNVHVGVRLQFSEHRFKFQVVAAHQARFSEVELHLLSGVQIV